MNVALFLEIKNEYTEHLVDTLAPYIYEGLTSIYKEAVRLANETNCEGKTLMIFQKLLQSINNWNQIRITEETNRIKQLSNTADYLDDLIKAVIKSNIILLAYSNSISNIIGQTFYNSLTTPTFVHRCYTECGKDAHNNPYLFFHDIDPMDYKRNQIIIHQHVQAGITRAVRKILPISMILKEYLLNSINIIQEPAKVELLGVQNNVIENVVPQMETVPKQMIGEIKPQSENKLDSKLEQEVLKIINSESTRSEKQKIQAIMNIDKILTSMEPNKPNEMGTKNSSSKKELSNSFRRNPEFLIAPHLMEQEENDYGELANTRLAQSDRNIININLDNEPSIHSNSLKKSISGTTLTGRGMPGKTGPRMNPETSERIDPTKVNLIEDYGSQIGGLKKNTRRLQRN
jgi:hypothetical protein